MQHYFSIGEISSEIGVSDKTLYKRAKDLKIDTSKITLSKKNKLIEACEEVASRKNSVKGFLQNVSSAKVVESSMISSQSGSTLEQRLEIAKQKFDFVNKCIADCELAIKANNVIIDNANGSISSNPAVKTMCELLKQHTSLQRNIQELEEKLKLISTSITGSVIDD